MNTLERLRKEQQAEKERILNDPNPTEKFSMIITPGFQKRIKIFDGAQKLRGDFPAVPNLTRYFQGRLKITVKAKIIDGQFELIKVLDR